MVAQVRCGMRSAGLCALGSVVAALVLSLLNARLGFWSERTGDLPVYVRAAERMAEGEEIYRPEDPRPFTYPPFLSLAAYPGSLLPESAQRPFWYCLNALVVLALFHLIRRRRRELAPARRSWPFWLLLAVLGGRHVSSVFENQSNDLLIVLLVALCADLAPRRDSRAGAMAGLGAALKATPLLFLPVFLWQRRWAAAAGLVAALAAATLLPDLVFPRNDGGSWVLAWRRAFLPEIRPGWPAAKVGGAWSESNILNQNLAGTLYRLSTPVVEDHDMAVNASLWEADRHLLRGIILLAQAAVFGVLLLATRPRWTRGLDAPEFANRRWGEAGAVACGMLLLSPMSSKSHFAILLLPLGFCLADYLYRRRDPVVLAHLLLVFAAGSLTTKAIWGQRVGNLILARGTVTLCALATLSATAYLLVRRGRSPEPR
jgi:hypothetical protein